MFSPRTGVYGLVLSRDFLVSDGDVFNSIVTSGVMVFGSGWSLEPGV